MFTTETQRHGENQLKGKTRAHGGGRGHRVVGFPALRSPQTASSRGALGARLGKTRRADTEPRPLGRGPGPRYGLRPLSVLDFPAGKALSDEERLPRAGNSSEKRALRAVRELCARTPGSHGDFLLSGALPLAFLRTTNALNLWAPRGSSPWPPPPPCAPAFPLCLPFSVSPWLCGEYSFGCGYAAQCLRGSVVN